MYLLTTPKYNDINSLYKLTFHFYIFFGSGHFFIHEILKKSVWNFFWLKSLQIVSTISGLMRQEIRHKCLDSIVRVISGIFFVRDLQTIIGL